MLSGCRLKTPAAVWAAGDTAEVTPAYDCEMIEIVRSTRAEAAKSGRPTLDSSDLTPDRVQGTGPDTVWLRLGSEPRTYSCIKPVKLIRDGGQWKTAP